MQRNLAGRQRTVLTRPAEIVRRRGLNICDVQFGLEANGVGVWIDAVLPGFPGIGIARGEPRQNVRESSRRVSPIGCRAWLERVA